MKKELYSWSKNSMKMIIHSDFKTFNEQTNCISFGNAIANTQYSNFIRPYNETICNGKHFEKGYLRDYDLQFFEKLNEQILSYIHEITENKGCMVYEFFIHRYNKKKVIGYVIGQEYSYRIFNLGDNRQYYKYSSALDLCKQIIEKNDNEIRGNK